MNYLIFNYFPEHVIIKITSFYHSHVERNVGLLFILFSQFFNAVMVTVCKVLEEDKDFEKPIHPLQILFVRQIITYISCLTFMYVTKVPDFLLGPRNIRKLLVLRGFSGFFGVFGLYYSVQYLSVSDAIVIAFLAPIWASIIAFFILKERFTIIEATGAVASLIGVLLIARPTFLFGHSNLGDDKNGVTEEQRILGTTVGLLGVIGAGIAQCTIRWIGKRAHPLISVAYFSLWCVIVSTVGLLVTPSLSFVFPHTKQQWILFISIGISGFCMQFLLTAGLQREQPSRITPIFYTQIIFAIIFDVVLWHQLPNLMSWIGTIIIVGSSAVVAYCKPNPQVRRVQIPDAESMPII